MTFKENCADIRNTKVIDIITGLREFGQHVAIHDAYAEPVDAQEHYGETLSEWQSLPAADAVVLAVAHRHYLDMPLSQLLGTLKPGGVVIDVKLVLGRDAVAALGFSLWRL